MNLKCNILEAQMLALRRHVVYGVFTAEKSLIYAGQTKCFDARLTGYSIHALAGKNVIAFFYFLFISFLVSAVPQNACM
jgi:hypothetical protein